MISFMIKNTDKCGTYKILGPKCSFMLKWQDAMSFFKRNKNKILLKHSYVLTYIQPTHRVLYVRQ